MPGKTARELANRLGVDKRSLNQFLHYEGKYTRGLYVREWRWYHSGVVQVPLPVIRVQSPIRTAAPNSPEPSPKPTTICGILLSISEVEVIRQIRRMDRLAVEKAFSEEHYPVLPDVLQIELVQRLHELNKTQRVIQTTQKPSPILLALAIIAIIASIPVLIKVLSLAFR